MVGLAGDVQLTEVAKIALKPEEMVTFMGPAGSEYDLTRKTWGWYATPSLNYRLPKFGLRAVLVKNPQGRWFVLLLEGDGGPSFKKYCEHEGVKIVAWLDDEATLVKIEQAL